MSVTSDDHTHEVPASELEQVLSTTDVTLRRLLHSTRTSVTRGVWRVTSGNGSAVLKVLSPGTADASWAGSRNPEAARYWKREALFYEAGLFKEYADAGFRTPSLLARFERSNGDIALWLEDIDGIPATTWEIERFASASRLLGRAQGAFLVDGTIPQNGWLSRNFLQDYLDSWEVDWSLLESDAAWTAPLIADLFPARLRDDLLRLHRERATFVSWLQRLPRTLCHLDLWPSNMFATADATVLIDWAFVGDGAVGEDIGNLIPDSVFDLWLPSAQLRELDRAVFDSYLEGLREAGWEADERLVRLGTCAGAIKYAWLGPYMLSLATQQHHVAYGREVSSETLYRERGVALEFLCEWAEEARNIASDLGYA